MKSCIITGRMNDRFQASRYRVYPEPCRLMTVGFWICSCGDYFLVQLNKDPDTETRSTAKRKERTSREYMIENDREYTRSCQLACRIAIILASAA
jgi:hypothetical protein